MASAFGGSKGAPTGEKLPQVLDLQSGPSAPGLRSIRILIVDDEATNVRLLERLLGGEHVQVVSARDGQEAWVMIQQQRPDLIVLDVTMPVLDGLALCRMIRANFRLQ